MIYGYVRVSSKGQLDNNSFEQQEEEIWKRYPDIQIYREQFSGATTQRPVFQELISHIKKGDTLVATKMDRFCRTTGEGLEIISHIRKQGGSIHILNMGLIEDTPMGNLITQCMLAFAEFERGAIIERTQAGKEIAKRNPNFREGRPRLYSDAQINHALELLEIHPYKDVVNRTGISRSTLARAARNKEQT